MRQPKKIYGLLMFSLVFFTVFTGCTKETTNKLANTSEELVVSEKIDLDRSYEEVHDIQKMADDTIRIGVSDKNGQNSSIFESSNQGESWTIVEELSDSIQVGNNDFLQFKIGGNGEIFIKVVKEASDYTDALNKDSQYFIMDADKKVTEINVALKEIEDHSGHDHGTEESEVNSLNMVEFTAAGELLATDFGNVGYLIDGKTGEIKQTYELLDGFGYADSVFSDKENVYFSSATGFLIYQKESGKLVTGTELEKAVSEKLEKSVSKNINVGTSIYQGKDENIIYFTNALGIYSYNNDTQKIDQKADLSESDLGLAENYARLLTVLDNEQYLLALTDFDSRTQSIYISKKHTGKEASAQKEKMETLAIWTLKESVELPKVIDRFKAENPNVNVEVQIGVDSESAQTVSDAISSLNTKMLANEGPDVILADGLPLDTYIEKGMLSNLQEMYDEFAKEDQLFDNIASSYKTKDGVFAIPQGFSYLAVTGKKEIIDQIQTTETLLSYLEQEDGKVGVDDAIMLTSQLYYSSINDWFDGETVDKEKLKQFFEQYRKLYEKIKPYDEKQIDFNQIEHSFYSGNFYLLVEKVPDMEDTDIALDYVGLPHLLYGIQTLSQRDYETTLFNGQSAKQFMPLGILSVSKSSENQEIAKAFIKFTLSKDGKNITGLPVSRQLFEATFQEGADGAGVEGTEQLSEAEYQEVVTFLNNLDTPINHNGVISETVVKQLEAYVLNNESVETAVNNTAKKIELYMSE
ncbi:ABC transporter substrate-binding protein [Enterococcus sp. UD-01]|jgi:ABC-type glycerol-3-phosphate transport system substrate-binding protein|uniref:ABC transporter substrate-binding protein n=1 Tax=Enterococcus sp. UD-01 TaxID=3373911 RepID=UPI00383909F0